VFCNEENGYTVAQFSTADETDKQVSLDSFPDVSSRSADGSGKKSFTAVGYFPYVEEGEHVILKGDWIVHTTFGRQFSVSSVLPVAPHATDEIKAYLSSGIIAGIGPKTAVLIVDQFGDDTLRILRDEPEKLSRIRGISLQKAKEISARMREKEDFRELSLLLIPLHISNRKIHEIYKRFGAGALNRIRTNPYMLAEEVSGIGFHTADQIAASIGIRPDSNFRFASAALHCLRGSENEGHTYVSVAILYDLVNKLLFPLSEVSLEPDEMMDLIQDQTNPTERRSERTDPFFRGIEELLSQKRIVLYSVDVNEVFQFVESYEVDWESRVSLPMTIKAEISSAKRLASRSSMDKVFPDTGRLRRLVETTANQTNIELSDEQKNAVQLAVDSYVSVITGGPGTGKTTIIRVLIEFFNATGQKTVLCAPTGRAAKRMSEASGQAAGTIHRLLEFDSTEHSEGYVVFKRNEDNPIDADAVIVDETSMLDIHLFDSLLRALQPNAQIIFVGDVNQLPSVGSGNVLSDIISSGTVPVASLTRVYRQANFSGIVKNAYRILNGDSIIYDQSLDSDCMLINRESSEGIADAAVKLYSKVLPEIYKIDVMHDAIVLCPSRKGPAGVVELNLKLQEAVGLSKGEAIFSRGFSFRLQDKVMQTRNNYDLSYIQNGSTTGKGVFNGEQGTIIELDQKEDIMTVMMEDGRVFEYNREAMEDLDPAYAITVHKSQGSEYPVVVFVVPPGYSLLNNRNLLYTAVTRAKKRLFLISSRNILNRAIKNRHTAIRRTSLSVFLRIFAASRASNE
jgi:exodeoxyribonuclease V alpha subunit